MAPPRYAPTEDQRRVVRTMAAYGIPQEAIARVVHCSEPTLRRAFRHELDTAVHEANARVAQCLYQQATTPGNVAASIFWLKARAGWREKQVHEITGADSAPLPSPNLVVTFVEPGRADAGQAGLPAPAGRVIGLDTGVPRGPDAYPARRLTGGDRP